MKSLIHSTYLFGFISLFIFSACTGSVEQKEESPADAFTFRSYQMNLNAPQVKFSELIDEMRIVQLEETEESLLGYVNNVKQSENYFYFTNGQEKAIYFFSKQGDFVHKIKRPGQGPGEYENIMGVWMEGDSVNVLDNYRKLHSYSPQGDHLSSQRIPYRTKHILPDNEGYWLGVTAYFIEDSTAFELVRVNRSFEREKLHLPIKEGFNMGISVSNNTFNKIDGQATYKHTLKDTVYVLEKDNVRPLVHFDFGNDYLWADPQMKSDPIASQEALMNGRKVWMLKEYVGDEYIFLSANTSFGTFDAFLIDRKSGDFMRLDRRNADGDKVSYVPNFWENEFLLMTIGSTDLRELLGNLEPEQYRFEGGATLEEIESSENQTLSWVKFKMPNR